MTLSSRCPDAYVTLSSVSCASGLFTAVSQRECSYNRMVGNRYTLVQGMYPGKLPGYIPLM